MMNIPQWETLWHVGKIWTGTSCASDPSSLDINYSVATIKDQIAWIGATADLPANLPTHLKHHHYPKACLLPGLVDCHTHLIFGGNRAQEFELRLKGISYEEIAKQGGGILNTVKCTRQLSTEALYEMSAERLKYWLQQGVTTIEIKSGYGLDLENELTMLRVARQLAKNFPIRIVNTLLAAHTVPPEYINHVEGYVDLICQTILPRAVDENLVDAMDVYLEHLAFDQQHTEKLFAAAQKLNLPVKIHADQLSHQQAALLAANYHALSADHLEYTQEDAIVKMAQHHTTAVLLPGAYYYLRQTQAPPIALLRQHQVPIALATDCNPGTSPLTSLLSVLNLACCLWQLTTTEALLGITQCGARALGLESVTGSIKVGKSADFSIWDIEHPRELCYFLGSNPLIARVFKGVLLKP